MNTPFSLDIDLSEGYTVIHNQSTYDAMVTGSCSVSIDFSSYDLIIGKKTLTTGLQSINYEVDNNCDTSTIDIAVNIGTNDATVAPNITYHVLIPKQSDNQNFDVSIIIL